ncbi:MAG: hypothetical protein JSR34_09775 [Proteobacteria bacterium]|nr:hypothetical protein [Pseudomonadota bacterium]
MNPRRDPSWVRVFERIYAAALYLYPRAHREQFGTPMRLAFRDRCRQAAREEWGVERWLIGVALPDLCVSVVRECFTPSPNIQSGDPMRIATAIVLEVVGSALIALCMIALWFAVQNDRFSHPGAFDALFALQFACGVGGAVLLAIGIRQLKPATRVRAA